LDDLLTTIKHVTMSIMETKLAGMKDAQRFWKNKSTGEFLRLGSTEGGDLSGAYGETTLSTVFRLLSTVCTALDRPVTKDSVVFDIGCGIGSYVLVAATCIGVPCITIGCEQDDRVYKLGESLACAFEEAAGYRVARHVENECTAVTVKDGMEGVTHLVGYTGSSAKRVSTSGDNTYLRNNVQVCKVFMAAESSQVMSDTKLSPTFFDQNLSDLPHAEEWKLGMTFANSRQAGGARTMIYIWVKTVDDLRPQQQVQLPLRRGYRDFGDGEILRMTVKMKVIIRRDGDRARVCGGKR
jgi:hypothetical protein